MFPVPPRQENLSFGGGGRRGWRIREAGRPAGACRSGLCDASAPRREGTGNTPASLRVVLFSTAEAGTATGAGRVKRLSATWSPSGLPREAPEIQGVRG